MSRRPAAPLAVGGVLCLLVASLASPVQADHLESGGYRCDGGWCSDAEERVLDCSGGGCSGETGGFTTILGPQFGDGSWLDGDDWVLGVSLHGEQKAYPIRIISGQQGWEMVSDGVGGEPVIVTYCPLCASGIVYSRAHAGTVLEFRNTGAIWNWDLVMFDLQTRTLWSQVSGEGLGRIDDRGAGTFDDSGLHGDELTLVSAEMVRWRDWKETHPATSAMERPVDEDGRPLCTCPSISLHPARLIHGIVLDGQALAFPLLTVAQEGIIHVEFAGEGLVATYRGDNVHVFEAAGRTFSPTSEARWMAADDGREYHAITGEARGGGTGLEKVAGRTTLEERWGLFFPESRFYQGDAELGTEAPGEGTPAPMWVALAGLAGAVALRRGQRR